jgi:hypothetical protein
VGAGFEGLRGEAPMRGCREDDDPGLAVPPHDLSGGLDPAGPRHLDVHHEDIGLELLDKLDGGDTIGTAGDDVRPGSLLGSSTRVSRT